MSKEKFINALIVDDAVQARKLLRLMLQEFTPDVIVKNEASNVLEAAEMIREGKPDVVFLDIEMPGKSGLQLAEEISRNEIPYEIIFTTAYNEYAIRAFRLSAVDYLLKPIDEKQLQEAVEKLRRNKYLKQSEQRLKIFTHNLNDKNEPCINIPDQNGYQFLKVSEILYIKADGSYTDVYCLNKNKITVSKNLKYFETVLSSFPQFMRVHRSFLINLQQMKRFDRAQRGTIMMVDGAEIDLARERRASFFEVAQLYI